LKLSLIRKSNSQPAEHNYFWNSSTEHPTYNNRGHKQYHKSKPNFLAQKQNIELTFKRYSNSLNILFDII